MQKKTFCVVLFAEFVFYVLTVWQACADIDPATAKKLLIADLAAQDYFGISVSLSADGKAALIGAFYGNQNGTASGCSYVFTYSDGSWTRQTKLTANDAAAVDFFGWSVSLSADGGTALIGAEGKDDWKGAAYIFTGSCGNWTQQAKLTAADGMANDMFGAAVSLSADGSTALIGACGKESYAGAAYIFARSSASIWTQQGKLAVSDSAANDGFGVAVSLSADGSTALIGADGKDSFKGAAYIFNRSGEIWKRPTKLSVSNGAVWDVFGRSVALYPQGGTAIVGVPFDTVHSCAYIFTKNITSNNSIHAMPWLPLLLRQ